MRGSTIPSGDDEEDGTSPRYRRLGPCSRATSAPRRCEHDPMSTVLLAIDGSALSTAAVKRSIELLGEHHRFLGLNVVASVLPAAAVGPMDSHPVLLDPEVEHELQEAGREEGAHALDALARDLGVPIESIVEVGEPGPAICEVADRVDADLVVVGSHGHGWLQRVLIGSVSTHVLHHAPCPVLVMRLSEPG